MAYRFLSPHEYSVTKESPVLYDHSLPVGRREASYWHWECQLHKLSILLAVLGQNHRMQSESREKLLCPLLKNLACLFDRIAEQRLHCEPMRKVQTRWFCWSDQLAFILHLTVVQIGWFYTVVLNSHPPHPRKGKLCIRQFGSCLAIMLVIILIGYWFGNIWQKEVSGEVLQFISNFHQIQY